MTVSMKSGTYEYSLQKSKEYFNGDDLAAKVFVDKYCLQDNKNEYLENSPNDMHWRQAYEIARIESIKFKEPYSADFIFSLLKDFKYLVMQGSIMYGLGNSFKFSTLSNCYVIDSPEDSYGGILRADEEIAQISKRRGGVGTDISPIRPNKFPTRNSSKYSTGYLPYMDRYSNTINEVGQEGRRGALMLTSSIYHPQIMDFITAKNDNKKVTGANISVRLSDEFLKAVDEDVDFELRWPVESENPLFKNKIKARELWNAIIHNAWLRAEPGILFWDSIVKFNAIDCYADKGFKTISTNPCCFAKDSNVYVVTKNGIKEIKDITNNDLIWIDYKQEWKKTSGYFDAGISDVYKVIFSNNEELYITNNHKLAKAKFKRVDTKICYDGFDLVELKDLSINDKISIHTHEVFNFNFGNKGTYEEGLILGWFTGDGCLSYHDDKSKYPDAILDFWNQEYDVAEKIHKIFDKWGYDLTLGTNGSNDVKRLRTQVFTKDFSDKYQTNMWLFKSEDMELPFLNECTVDFFKGFISSYFSADGTISHTQTNKNYHISLASINKNRLIQIKNILLYFGIRSTVALMHKAGERQFKNNGLKYKTKNCWRLFITGKKYIKRFYDIFGLISDFKNERLNKIVNIEREKESKYQDYVSIKSIELIGQKLVGCIEVEDEHSLTANGLISGQSELPLCAYDSCRLMVQNLYGYVNNPFTKDAYFDFKLFHEHAQILQRIMDDVIDLELEKIDLIIGKIKSDPESEEIKQRELKLWEKIRVKCIDGRRTGCGITALGDVFAALNIPYASEESIQLAEKIAKTQKLGVLRGSVDMAKEIGPFPVWDWNKEKDSEFLLPIQKEDPQLYEDMSKYGRRNIGHLTIAPTGSVSILTQTTSGIEPLFMMSYTRRKKINLSDENVKVDFVDELGQKWQHFEVYHPKIKEWMQVTGETDLTKSPWYKCTADEIDWKNRVKLQAVMQKHIDHAISSCLAIGKNYILTSHGLLDIGELADKYKVNLNENIKKFTEIEDDIFSVNSKNKKAVISAIYNNGLAEVLKFNLDNGSEITCTKNHKLMVLNKDYSFDWKESSLITEGDWIVGRKGLNIWGSTGLSLTSMIGSHFEYKKLTNSKNISFPIRMSVDLARLIGYLCSDGSVGINGISLSQIVNNVGPDFCNIVENIFKVKTAINPDLRSNNLNQYVANGREIAAFFKWLGITNHDEIRVPKVIRMSGSDCVKNFIKGVTLDGYVSKHVVCVATSVSENYLKDIRELLLNIGIESKVFNSSKEGFRKFPCGKTYHTKKAYSLIICDSNEIKKFADMIGFAENRKNEDLKNKYKRTTKIKIKGEIPDYNLRLKFRSEFLSKIKSSSLYDKYHSLTAKDKQGRLMSRETLLEMQDLGFFVEPHLIDSTYTFSKIKSIKNDGFQQTVDLSVPVGNSYIANGLISHNTINLPEDVTEDKVAEIYTTAWKAGVKGITVYRKNCRAGVLIDKPEVKKESIIKNDAPKRPNELKADAYFVKTKGESYYVVIGLLNNEPYEVFTGKNLEWAPFTGDNREEVIRILPDDLGDNLFIKKIKRGLYELVDINNDKKYVLNNGHSDDNAEALTRMISTSLRHGADISFVVHQLEKTKGDMSAFAKVISRTLKKYIKDGTKVHGETCASCQSSSLERGDGCVICKNCGWTKCN